MARPASRPDPVPVEFALLDLSAGPRIPSSGMAPHWGPRASSALDVPGDGPETPGGLGCTGYRREGVGSGTSARPAGSLMGRKPPMVRSRNSLDVRSGDGRSGDVRSADGRSATRRVRVASAVLLSCLAAACGNAGGKGTGQPTEFINPAALKVTYVSANRRDN